SPEGEPVRLAASTTGGGVELRVSDRGPGIRPADRERVFEAFQRLGDSPRGAGVGLGLAVARGFVEAMGGELYVEDRAEPDTSASPAERQPPGTTMVVRLPAARSSLPLMGAAPAGRRSE
ncbi:MAG: sensor histidine kinase, partial [Acidimicrobiales bacterium]